jgi:hypothetical protein
MKVMVRKDAHVLRWQQFCQCGNCKSELFVDGEDLRRRYISDPRPGESIDYAWFRCPVCSERNEVNVTVSQLRLVQKSSEGSVHTKAKILDCEAYKDSFGKGGES